MSLICFSFVIVFVLVHEIKLRMLLIVKKIYIKILTLTNLTRKACQNLENQIMKSRVFTLHVGVKAC